MNKSTFYIPGMDCPTEERIIRLRMEKVPQVKGLFFNLEGRQLEVVHPEKEEGLVLQVIGSIVFLIVLRGANRILKLA